MKFQNEPGAKTGITRTIRTPRRKRGLKKHTTFMPPVISKAVRMPQMD